MERDNFWRFYGRISLEIVWGFLGENMVNKIARQYPYSFYQEIIFTKRLYLMVIPCMGNVRIRDVSIFRPKMYR